MSIPSPSSSPLLSVEDAVTRILQSIATAAPLPSERVALENSPGRVLADDIFAPQDVPAFANSSMDGYAVRAADIAPARRDTPALLHVVDDIPAGVFPTRTLHEGEAARIMTGAPLPPGANAVVPVENTDAAWRGDRADASNALAPTVEVYSPVQPGNSVRAAGEDMRAGEKMLSAGTCVRPTEVALLAALGLADVSVISQPRVAIISGGDELIEPGQPLQPGQIYNSNAYALAALVQQAGGLPTRIRTAQDTLEDTRRAFADALAIQPHLILSSAGVSVGAHDHVRTVVEEMGAVAFWRVNVRPGKPLAFGQVQRVPFIGLPGNPVSAQVTYDLFVRPLLHTFGGLPTDSPTILATLTHDLKSDGRRSYIRVILHKSDVGFTASTTGTQSSGALSSMIRADGLLIVPEGITEAKAGERFRVRVLNERILWEFNMTL